MNKPTASKTKGVMAAALISSLSGLALNAQDANSITFSQPAQSLSEALADYTEATGVSVVARGGLLEGKTAPALSGDYSNEAALGILLASSGLNLRKTDTGSVILSESNRLQIEEIELVGDSGEDLSSFAAREATSATLIPLALKDTPYNVGVIKESLLEDLQIDTLSEAVLLNASVQRSHFYVSTAPAYSIRGFNVSSDQSGFLIDGVPVSAPETPPAHSSALQRIEILKGSAAMFYGAGDPAGVINYIYKTPQAEEQYSIKTTVGQYDKYSAELDATGSIGGSDKFLYRFTLGLEDSKGYIDYDFRRDIAPTLQLLWKPTEMTSIKLVGEYVDHESNPIMQNTFFISEGDWLETPKETYWGYTNDFNDQTSEGVRLQFDHAFTEELKITAQVGHNEGFRETAQSGFIYDYTSVPAIAGTFAFLPTRVVDLANNIYPASTFQQKRGGETDYIAAHIQYDFQTGNIAHKLLGGVNYSRTRMQNGGQVNGALEFVSNFALLFDPTWVAGLPDGIDILNPNPTSYDRATNFESSPPFYRQRWQFENIGINLQNAVEIPALDLSLLLGVRFTDATYDQLENTDENGVDLLATNTSERNEENSAVLPRIGAVYDFNDSYSVFASYSESFKPSFSGARDIDGNIIDDPETSDMIEMGLRGSFFDDRLSATLAYFQITKNDVIVATGLPNVSELVGEQESRGFELDIAGSITEDWNIYLSYAHIETEILDGGTTAQNTGDPFPGKPEDKLVLWNNYDLGSITGVEGLRVGYGFEYQSHYFMPQNILSQGLVKVPGQGFIHNLGVMYDTEIFGYDVKMNLSVKNVADDFYVLTSQNGTGRKGDPRTVTFSLTTNF
ncbi:MAG: TonB-dependent receptor [Verrucomicrobiota bacterium]